MPDTTPSDHFDRFVRDELIHAGRTRNAAAIDEITDRLAQQGMCRPRADMSRMAEWVALRPPGAKPIEGAEAILAEAAVDGLGDIGAQLAAHFRGSFAGVQA